MAVTKRYAVYCHGELIGEYTAVDAAAMLKCTPGTVRTYASAVISSTASIRLRWSSRRKRQSGRGPSVTIGQRSGSGRGRCFYAAGLI